MKRPVSGPLVWSMPSNDPQLCSDTFGDIFVEMQATLLARAARSAIDIFPVRSACEIRYVADVAAHRHLYVHLRWLDIGQFIIYI